MSQESTALVNLSPAQSKIVKSNKRFRVVVTGRRFGKTVLSVWEMFGYALYKSGSRVVYISPTIKQSRDIAWALLKSVTKVAWARDPNETRLELTVKCHGGGTSEIWLRGAENIESLRGLGIHFLVIDEIASLSDWTNVWSNVLRPTLVDTKGQALFIGSPKGFNHLFDLYSMGNIDSDYECFTFTSYDNPYVDRSEIDAARMEAERNGTMDEFRQEYLAEFVSVSGQVYTNWDFTKQYIPLEYDPKLPLHMSIDFGVNDPTAIIWIQRNGGEFRVIDYYEASDGDVGHFVQVIRSKPYKQAELITGDPAGNARAIVTNTSPIEEYAKAGIHIRTKDGVRIPEQISITKKYVKSMYVDNKLDRFRDCILNYRYPKKRETMVNQSNEIPVHDQYSHAMRALEYYFVNIDTGISSQRVITGFPKQQLFDKYGVPNH